MPRPGSTRFTEQTTLTGWSSIRFAVNPAAFEPARRCICDAHEAGEAPCLGSQASAHGLSRRSHVLRILSPQARDYDTDEACFVPNNVAYANSEYYSPLLAPGSSDTPSDGSFDFCKRL